LTPFSEMYGSRKSAKVMMPWGRWGVC
jgi:hypothetical protein